MDLGQILTALQRNQMEAPVGNQDTAPDRHAQPVSG